MKRILCRTIEETEKLLSSLNTTVFSFDTETNNETRYDKLVIDGISFCDGDTAGYIYLADENRNKLMNLVKGFFSSLNKSVIIAHNIVFDAKVLHKYGITLKGEWFDTMIAAHLIDENREYGLKYLAREVLNKDVVTFDEVKLDHNSDEFGNYGIDDAVNTWELAQIFKRQLEELEMTYLFRKIEMPFQRVLLEMEITGVLVDQDKLNKFQSILQKEIITLETQLYDLLDEKYSIQMGFNGNILSVSGNRNFNSNQQLADILFNKLGLEIIERTETGLPKTGKVTINKYKKDIPFVECLYKYKIATKLLNGFVGKDGQIAKNIQADGRVRPYFNDCGTKTGRLSCIAKGTKIQTVRDFSKEPEGKNIENIKPGDLVYSSDKYGRLVTRKVRKLIDNGNQKCIKLKWKSLSNKFSGELICTPDHKIKNLNDKWTRADELQLTSLSEICSKRRVGEELPMESRGYSLHFQISDYAHIYYPGMRKVKNTRFITNAPFNMAVHHRDKNKLNDTLENLQLLTHEEHHKLHAIPFIGERQQKAQDTLKRMRENGEIQYNRTKDEWSYDYCIYLAHKHKGMIKYIIQEEHHDFETIKREMNRHKINLRWIKKLYEQTNHFFVGREDAGVHHVYDLEIEGEEDDTHNFFANEICVHNCHNPNLQQLPKEKDYSPVAVRELFIVPNGYKMITSDYSGQELRVLAHVCNEPNMIKAFKEGKDFHQATADQFGVSRTQAKAINFGIAYRKGAYGFSQDWNCSEEEAQKVLDKYFQEFPAIKRKMDLNDMFLKENGYVKTMAGRRRHFQKIDDKYYKNGSYREAFNFLIQGFSADMIRAAMVNVYVRAKKYPEWDLKTIMTVHDESVWQVKEEYLEDAMKLINDTFEKAVKLKVPTPSDTNYGVNYNEAK